jgi:Flp pilus assembly protein TadD
MARKQNRLSLRRKLVYGLVPTILPLLLLELILWACGVRPIAATRDPFVGFRPGVPLFVRQDDRYVTNPLRTVNFNKQEFVARKAAGTLRIFCLGGSTTYGHPYDARVAYPMCLKRRLERLMPGRQFEVINCGGVSYASYRLAIIADELVNYEPDLIVVHTGHNEFLERRTYHGVRERPKWQDIIMLAGSQLRTLAVLSRWLESIQKQESVSVLSEDVLTILEQSDGPQSYHRDDQQYEETIRHLEFSLRRINEAARSCGSGVVFVRPASDLRGTSPFRSEASVEDPQLIVRCEMLLKQALSSKGAEVRESQRENLQQAVELDPRYAEAQWQLGRVLLEAEELVEARRAFVNARDEDVCPLRATSEIEMLIESVAAETDSELVNFSRHVESVCQAKYGYAIPGPESFLDHVHLTIERHADLAVLLTQALIRMELIEDCSLTETQEQEWRNEIDRTLNSEDQGIALHTLSMTLGWAGKNEEAQRLSRQAIELVPNEGRVHTQLGRLLEKAGDREAALTVYQQAAKLDGENTLVLYRLGALLLELGRRQEARAVLGKAIKQMPESAPESFRQGLFKKYADSEIHPSTEF